MILRKSLDANVAIIVYLVVIVILITNILQHEFGDNSVEYER